MSATDAFFRERVWRCHGLTGKLAWLAMRPLATAFGFGVRLRSAAYRIRLLRSKRAGIPVVSVGNLSVGGTGKTPFALWLAEQLRAKGWRPAIVLRGYRGMETGPTLIAENRVLRVPVASAGDEAAMLGKRFGGAVFVARRRFEGATAAREAGCDIVVLDDGFQHRALARDCDIVLVAGRATGLLPAGPLREPLSALRRADAVIQVDKGEPPPARLSAIAPALHRVRFVATALVESVRGEWQERPLGLLAGRRVATVTGVADAQPFYDMLTQWEAEIVEIIALEDHHRYTAQDWQRIAYLTRNVDLVLTTEKDLVKLEAFPFAVGKLLALRIAPEVEDAASLLDLVCARAGRAKGEDDGDQSGPARYTGVPAVQG